MDPESAILNCKYDTCSCLDSSCACHAIKSYVKECLEKGIVAVEAWRDKASFCRKFTLGAMAAIFASEFISSSGI